MSRKKRFDELMEAITFAEAGEMDTASALAAEVFPDASAGERLLAVSGAQGFSRRMVEDSISMAERLGYGIVALSVSPAMSKLFARLRRGARARGARLSPDAFRAQAAERGIPFVHAVRSGNPERAVAEVSRRFRRIAFLVIDPELAATARFSAVDIPIFTFGDA